MLKRKKDEGCGGGIRRSGEGEERRGGRGEEGEGREKEGEESGGGRGGKEGLSWVGFVEMVRWVNRLSLSLSLSLSLFARWNKH